MASKGVMSQMDVFVVIDYHAESRYLLVKTLRRKFADAIIHETDDADEAVTIAQKEHLDAIITHRTFDMTGLELIRRLRAADHKVPIIMVSGVDRAEGALAAGANCFLHYDEWLRIGTVVEAQLRLAHESRMAHGSDAA